MSVFTVEFQLLYLQIPFERSEGNDYPTNSLFRIRVSLLFKQSDCHQHYLLMTFTILASRDFAVHSLLKCKVILPSPTHLPSNTHKQEVNFDFSAQAQNWSE